MKTKRELLKEMGYEEVLLNNMTDEECEVEWSYLSLDIV